MLSTWILSLHHQFSAEMKKPQEFFVGLITLILNNCFYLYGIYLLAILSNRDDPIAIKEYLVSTGIVLLGWGGVNVLAGGLLQLGRLIETGELEPYLSKPRSPLFLVAIAKSNLLSIGELFQGLLTIVICSLIYDPYLGFRMFLSSIILAFAFAGVIIFINSLSFLFSRGSQISYVLLQVLLNISLFPVGRALKGKERWILYFTPLVLTATLPRLVALEGGFSEFLIYITATTVFFYSTIFFFKWGLHRFKSQSYIFLNE